MVDLDSILDWYKSGGNIIELLTQQHSDELDQDEIIQIAYDIQAGSYTQKALANPEVERERGAVFASIMDEFGGVGSMLDVGVGEATTLTSIVKQLKRKPKALSGLDISFSRIAYARKFVEDRLPLRIDFAVAEMSNCPLEDSSVDLVYTVHALEPNGGNEVALLKELYRVTGKYLVLFEPSYELGDKYSRRHIEKHNYVRGLVEHAHALGYNVIENKLLFDSNQFSANNTSVIVIEKPCSARPITATNELIKWACPISKKKLININGCHYSPKARVAYPQIDGIPILLHEKSILSTHFDKFS